MSRLDLTSVEVADVKLWDAPDFVDAFIESAEYDDGTPLTEDELEALTNDYDFLHDQIMRKLY